MSPLDGFLRGIKNRADEALDHLEAGAASLENGLKAEIHGITERAGELVSRVAPQPPPAPAPAPIPEGTDAKAAEIDRILAGGVPGGVPILSRALGPLGNKTEPVLAIIRSCKGGAELDAILTRIGRNRLVDSLDSVEKTGPAVAAAIDEVRARDLKPGDWRAFDRYLDDVTGTVARPGNKVTLLDEGPKAFEEIYKAIDGAKSSVNVASYHFEDDSTGREYARHLIDAARRGVTVNVVMDKQANLMVGGYKIAKLLRQNGVNVVENPGEPLMGAMDHRKFSIIDGTTGFCGGMNIGDKYAKSEWRDMHSKLEGPAVADLQRAFMDRWRDLRGATPPESVNYFPPLAAKGDERVRALQHRGSGIDENIRLTYLRAIDTATASIKIEDPFFVDAEVLDHLARAARRGVDVSLVWPGDNVNPVQAATARARYGALIAAGAKVYELPGMTHAKVCVIDGKFGTIGSSNLDQRALQRDWEMNLVVTEPSFAGTLGATLDRDIARSKRITEAPKGVVSKVTDPLLQDSVAEDVLGRLP